jgi:hypothetical protein
MTRIDRTSLVKRGSCPYRSGDGVVLDEALGRVNDLTKATDA